MSQPLDLVSAINELDSISEWEREAKKRKAELRKLILAEVHPGKLKEGTNKAETDEFVFDIKLQVKRTVDEAALSALRTEHPEGVPWDTVFVYKPALNTRYYKSCKLEFRKFISQALIVKPQTPQLSYVRKND